MATPTQNSEIEVSHGPLAVSSAHPPTAAIETSLPVTSETPPPQALAASASIISPSPSQDLPAPIATPVAVAATSNAATVPATTVQQIHPSQNPSAAAPHLAPIPIPIPVTPNSSVTPVLALPKQQPHATKSSIKKNIGTKLWETKPLLFALVVVGLLDGLALSASSTNSPLGSISSTSGILVLSILAQLTGYALSSAANTVWGRAPFKILARKQSSGLSLIVFWTLITGVGGSCLILWREFCKLWPCRSKANNPNTNNPAHSHQHVRDHPTFWSTLRIASWVMMQFPGIIIMTVVNTKTSYIPIHWTPIAGGIGVYDPKAVSPDADPILITNSALSILQDTTKAVQVDPVNPDCIQARDSCKAFLIPGGLQNVTPWPYQKLQDPSLDAYVTKGGPAYQIDFWTTPQNVTWPSDECSVYAANEDESFQLCTSLNADGKTIMAGWTPCTGTVLPSGECDQPYSWEAFNYTATFISISRRTATVYSMRDTSLIVAWEDLGTPQVQAITPSDLKTAFDTMVVPWNSSSLAFQNQDNILLTAQIATTLRIDLDAPESTKSLDYLYDFFATPLYVFNPLLLGSNAIVPYITDIQPGLPVENYINGSYARTRDHAVPEHWTVLVYVIVSGILLLSCFLGLIVGTGLEGLESSEFPFIDSMKLRWSMEYGDGREFRDIRDVFSGVDLANKVEVLEYAAGVRIKLETRINHGV